MAAKRFFDGDDDQPNQKRTKTRPSFASVIREVVMVNFFENFCSSLEPMLRKVVSEEVEKGLGRRRTMMSSSTYWSSSLAMIPQGPSMRINSLELKFAKTLSLPIFTGTKIVDAHGDPLTIILGGGDGVPTSIRVEIVVLDGDFPSKDDVWTSDDFARNIVKERNGKRPLLTGDLSVTVRGGVASVGDLEFTDNSSWIRSRKFRLGARVAVHGEGVVIREAITEAFVVKDHRGELYKKHHPPALEDEVWRLEKIGKGGAFHTKLASHGVNTVQDFLKLYNVDASALRSILGVGMSEKMWEVTLKHAKTCVLGTTLYRYRANNYTLTLNPVCQLVNADFNGQLYHQFHLDGVMQKAHIERLVKDAYAKWKSLEELDGLGLLHQIETPLLITQDEMVGQYPKDEQQLVIRSSYGSDSISSCSVIQNNQGDELWALNSADFYLTTNNNTSALKNGIRFCSESSSEGDNP